MELIKVSDHNMKLIGSTEELLALSEGLKMKAKLLDQYSLTYTGITDIKLYIECTGSDILTKFGIKITK